MALVAPTPTLAEQALRALAVHRMLTAEQLRELLTPAATATTHWSARLAGLARGGLVRALPTRGARTPKVWCATRDGLRVALGDRSQIRHYEVPPGGGILQAHTLALNEAGLAFVRAARATGDDCDCWSWEHEVAHTMGGARRRNTLIADAVLSYGRVTANGTTETETLLQRFIELDRATEPVHKLADQVRRYAAYHRWAPDRPDAYGVPAGQPAWRGRYPRWPVLCVVIGANPAKGRRAIERRIDSLIGLCARDPLIRTQRIGVVICAYEDLVARGPWAPIWWRLDAPEVPVDVAGELVDPGLRGE